jgi:hypothetical protein
MMTLGYQIMHIVQIALRDVSEPGEEIVEERYTVSAI